VPDRQWEGHGPEFTLRWGGRTWALSLDQANPGLYWSDGRSIGKLLSLHGLAVAGRAGAEVFTPAALVGFARLRRRVEATFAPPDWGGVTVRAAWSPTPNREAVDLEVQVNASSVGELQDFEAHVVSLWCTDGAEIPSNRPAWVEPRDRRSAALTYDGRESLYVLSLLTTLPVPNTAGAPLEMTPRVFSLPRSKPETHYLEMVQPNDCARRILGGSGDDAVTSPRSLSTRYALFGYDLEKGVVLRARLRGIWIRSKAPQAQVRPCVEEFLNEPLPLGP
jgi:hypothetical protein